MTDTITEEQAATRWRCSMEDDRLSNDRDRSLLKIVEILPGAEQDPTLTTGLARLTFTFELEAQCPYQDETDRHQVDVVIRPQPLPRADRVAGQDEDYLAWTFEAGSIAAYVASWEDVPVTVEALTLLLERDFRRGYYPGTPIIVDVSVTTGVARDEDRKPRIQIRTVV